MRTTVTLDDDVLRELRRLMKAEDRSFKDALNETVRRGLAAGRQRTNKRRRFRVRPHSSEFRSGIDPGKLNQLVDELEAAEFASKQHGRS